MVSIKLEITVIKKFCNRVYEEDIFFNNEEPAVCSWIIFFSSQLITNERLKVGEK